MDNFTPIGVDDARPALEPARSSPWTHAEKIRDEFAETIDQAASQAGLKVLVSKSQPGEFPLSIRMVAWESKEHSESAVVTKRNEFTITFQPNPYLVHPIEFDIKVFAKRRLHQVQHWDVRSSDLRAITLFTLGRGGLPAIFRGARRREFASSLPLLALFVERNRLIDSVRGQKITGPNLLGLTGAVLLIFALVGSATVDSAISSLSLMAGVALLVGALIWAGRREHVYSVVRRPTVEPRRLGWPLDSWHTSVPGVGGAFEDLLDRLEHAVTDLDPSITKAWETHQYRTPYGFEERRRITLTKGQAVVHLHIHPFAADAFVGWDGFLNWARWAETEAVSVSVRDGKRLEYRSLAVANHSPSHFDLVEFSALTELVHRRLVEELKRFLKERSIEADLDFNIIRGNRENALKATEAHAQEAKKQRSFMDVVAPQRGQ
jgi:hypothetical protein